MKRWLWCVLCVPGVFYGEEATPTEVDPDDSAVEVTDVEAAMALSEALESWSESLKQYAEDIRDVVEPPKGEVSIWEWDQEIGFFFDNTNAGGADTSRDTIINDTNNSMAWSLRFRSELTWREDDHEASYDFRARYGEKRKDGGDWVEDKDEITLNGEYLRHIEYPHFVGLRTRLETVFTGPDREVALYTPIEEEFLRLTLGDYFQQIDLTETEKGKPLDPLDTWIALEYGQRYENILLPKTDSLDARVGVRYDQRWGSNRDKWEKRARFGPSFSVRYSNRYKNYVRWWVSYEATSTFDDMSWVQHLGRAEMRVRLTSWLRLELEFRAYYEHAPKDVIPVDGDGFEEWSWRQESDLGLVWEF